MPRSRAGRFAVRFTALGVAAGTLAGYSAYANRWMRTPELALNVAGEHAALQISNSAAKADRLKAEVPALPAPAADAQTVLPAPDKPAVFALAAVPRNGDLDRFTDMMTGTIPAALRAEPTEPTKEQSNRAGLTLLPLPHEKPKRPAPPPAPPQASGVLDDNQIAALKGRLRLTTDQAEYWPAVEDALREVVRTQLRPAGRHARAGKINIDVNSPEVQKLIWAAVPLIMRLREDQKNEVRKLARVIGLEQVASQI